MLAMVVNDNAGNQMPRGDLEFIASKLGSYRDVCCATGRRKNQ
ncbi:hypothetical protein PMHK_09990 [Pseudomonas sp. MHK4]|jgi:hypothetical protein